MCELEHLKASLVCNKSVLHDFILEENTDLADFTEAWFGLEKRLPSQKLCPGFLLCTKQESMMGKGVAWVVIGFSPHKTRCEGFWLKFGLRK